MFVAAFFPHRAYLDYMHVRCFRRTLGTKAVFYRRICNADVLRRAGAECLEAYLLRKQLALLGHILHREQDHPDRLACLESNVDLLPRMTADTRRRRGRPRLTCATSILPSYQGFFSELTTPESER